VAHVFAVNERDLPWFEYEAAIRVKALTKDQPGIPPVQFVEYAPDHCDPIHRHDVDEFFVVTEGALWLDDTVTEPGGLLFVPRDTEYALRAGAAGARFFRVVVP
jgi:quercetin dioxygenase-like cupin family protein